MKQVNDKLYKTQNELADIRRQLAEMQARNDELEAQAHLRGWCDDPGEIADLRRQLAECQADAERYKAKFYDIENDWLAERKQVQIITEDRDYVLRQLAECAGTDPTVPMLQRVKAAVDDILTSLNPDDFNEPINWGDLYAASVSFRIDDDGRTSTLVEIEEAAPGCEQLCKVVSDRLALMGWQGVMVATEW